MHSANQNWKTEISDLKSRARAVVDAPTDVMRMSPRAAARCLSGVISLICRDFSVDVMQRACADLVRCDAAWETRFGTLPRSDCGVPRAIEMLAVVARGILPLAGADSMRAALAFWASEDDPAQWQAITTGVAA